VTRHETRPEQLPQLRIDLTDDAGNTDDVDAFDFDLTDLAATDALLDRLARGELRRDTGDLADPAVEVFAGLVQLIDLDAAGRVPDVEAIIERANHRPEAEQDGPELDGVMWLGRRSTRRAGSVRHAKLRSATTRTIRVTPLAAAAAAAAVIVGAALFIDTSPEAETTQAGVTPPAAPGQGVDEGAELLRLARAASIRGDQKAAEQYVQRASRILTSLPPAQRLALAKQIQSVAKQIGVTAPPIVYLPPLATGGGGPTLPPPVVVRPSPSPTPDGSPPPTYTPPVPTTPDPTTPPVTDPVPTTPDPTTPTTTDPTTPPAEPAPPTTDPPDTSTTNSGVDSASDTASTTSDQVVPVVETSAAGTDTAAG